MAITPGPDNLYVMMQSSVYGYKTGVIITLGLCTGLIVHSIAVALGLATLIQTLPFAFSILQLIGVAYLVYLSWQAYRASSGSVSHQTTDSYAAMQFYRRGIIMNISNPKIGLFFLAFLPQFTEPAQGEISTQIILLACLFISIAFVVMSSIALLANALSQWLLQSQSAQRSIHRLTALILLGLAFHIVLTR